jgi:hypothetical protein
MAALAHARAFGHRSPSAGETTIVLNRSQFAKLRVVRLLCYHRSFDGPGPTNHSFKAAR